MEKILHVYSGGLDSTVLLFDLLAQGNQVRCLNFHYGSNHNMQERFAARNICFNARTDLQLVDLNFIKNLFKSSLLEGAAAIPEGHYQAENMKSTVVPFRNAIMLSIAVGFAESVGCSRVTFAAHAGDHYIYPDCRPAFIDAFEDAAREGTFANIKVDAPYYDRNKTDIAKIGLNLKAPVFDTYSCYKGGPKHCGKCGACTERKEAFKDAGAIDLTLYEGE